MDQEEVLEELRGGTTWLWFVGGCALSVATLGSIVLLVLLLISMSLNAYLAWTLSGYEISVGRVEPISTVVAVAAPTEELAMVPSETPTPVPTNTPAPVPTESTLEAELSTLAAVATNAAETESASTPTSTPVIIAPGTSQAAGSAPTSEAAATPTAESASSQAATSPDAPVRPLAESTNSYALIPIEGDRESRPPAEHGDLNLKLRDPQPAQFEPSLIDIPGAGIDPNAPSLSSVFEPDFVATYAVHDWDWGCNCKGSLIQDGSAVLAGIKTTPGEPVFIPKTDRDIYQGKYYAVVLYASEDSLTFLYARRGNVVSGYTVHFLGLQTDPNLLALFQEGQGSELPGLTLDTPVGVATDELIVAVRDNGTFLDTRSRLDWWD